MIRASKTLAAACALAALSIAVPAAAAGGAKEAKIKLETLKPGKLKLDPRLGYILVRVGPNPTAQGKPLMMNFTRVDEATGKLFWESRDKEIADVDLRTLQVALNTGRSFGTLGEGQVYVLSAYPGRWAIQSVGGNGLSTTCLSMGTYTFDVKQGQISDIGLFLTAREDGKSTLPEFAGASLSKDLVQFGTMMNIVMTDALYAKPATETPSLPAELAAMPLNRAELSGDFRFDNVCSDLPNRARSLAPLQHQAPLSAEAAVGRIAVINGEEGKETAQKPSAAANTGTN